LAESVRDLLIRGVQRLGIELPGDAAPGLLAFVKLLGKWNRTFNLTAVRDPVEVVTRHLLDSLAVLPFLEGERVVDVGSGAGLPGIPLALASPERRFVLLDSNSKKTRFLTQAVTELGLTNVEVVRSRAEDYRPEQGFDTVISRAFATLAATVHAAGHLCAPHGIMLVMKGVYPGEELEDLPPTMGLRAVHRLEVPGLAAERHLVCLAPCRQGDG